MRQSGKSKAKVGGGVFIALGMLFGAIIGIYLRQPSAGMVIGFAVGALVAIAIWALDSKRDQGT